MKLLVTILAILLAGVNSQQCIKLMTSLCDDSVGNQQQQNQHHLHTNRGIPGKVGRPGNDGPQGPAGPKGEPGENLAFNSTGIEKELEDLKSKLKNQNKKLNAQNELLESIKKVAAVRDVICSVGMADGRIKVGQISASSINPSSTYHRLDFARLHSPGRSWLAEPATAKIPGRNWLQVDLNEDVVLNGIATQGGRDADQWATTYKVTYKCNNCDAFIPVSATQDNQPKVFTGNYDRNSVVRNQFPASITARYVRIYPLSWHNWPGIRMELYTC